MSKTTNYDNFKLLVNEFFKHNLQEESISTISLREASKSNADKNNITYFYNGIELDIIDMDNMAKNQYKNIRVSNEFESVKDDIVNTTDGFIIDKENKWYFIEFKDCQIKKNDTKKSVIKKAYGNWYMLLDILYNSFENRKYDKFNYTNPIRFAKENVIYILVCNSCKNPNVITQIKNYKYNMKRYTPEFMQKIKEYLFNDAYVYTEIEFEREFVKKFQY